MQNRVLFVSSVTFAVASLVFGGSSATYSISETGLRLAALPLLAAGFLFWWNSPVELRPKWAVWFWSFPVVFALLQIIPLPSGTWGSLANHTVPMQTLSILGNESSWLTTSAAPEMTRLAALAQIPAFAMFLAVLSLGQSARRRLLEIVTLFGCGFALFGILQSVQALDAQPVSGITPAHGFFANRNHFAVYLACVSVSALCLIALQIARFRASDSEPSARHYTKIAFCVTTVFLALMCQTIVLSRAGFALEFTAIIAGFVAFFILPLPGKLRKKILLPFASLTLGMLLLFAIFGLDGLLDRFDSQTQDGGRIAFATITLSGATRYFPLGSGLGTFTRVFPTLETKETLLPGIFVNHAHNEFAEILLETGIFGALWILAFLVWWIVRTIKIWKSLPDGSNFRNFEASILARAGTIIVGLLLLHSLVDYPLRTQALAVLFALCCAFMLPSLNVTRSHGAASGGRGAH